MTGPSPCNDHPNLQPLISIYQSPSSSLNSFFFHNSYPYSPISILLPSSTSLHPPLHPRLPFTLSIFHPLFFNSPSSTHHPQLTNLNSPSSTNHPQLTILNSTSSTHQPLLIILNSQLKQPSLTHIQISIFQYYFLLFTKTT